MTTRGGPGAGRAGSGRSPAASSTASARRRRRGGAAAGREHPRHVLERLDGEAAPAPSAGAGAAAVEALLDPVALGGRDRAVEEAAGQQLDVGAGPRERRRERAVIWRRERGGIDEGDPERRHGRRLSRWSSPTASSTQRPRRSRRLPARRSPPPSAGIEHEILVLDNASDDGSVDLVAQLAQRERAIGDRLRLIVTERRQGKAANDTLLLEAAKGELLPAPQRGLRAAARAPPRRCSRRSAPTRAPAPPGRSCSVPAASRSRAPGGCPASGPRSPRRSSCTGCSSPRAAASGPDGRLGAVGGAARPPRRGRADRLARPRLLRLLGRDRLLQAPRRRRLAHALRPRRRRDPPRAARQRPLRRRAAGSSSSTATATSTCASTMARPRRRPSGC